MGPPPTSTSASFVQAQITTGQNSDPNIARMAIDALVRNMEIIGEAVGRLSPTITSTHPEVPWRAIVGMRNTLIHQYFDVDASVVIESVDIDLDPLEEALRSHL